MLLSGLALAVSIDLASGIEVLAYFESNASSVGETFYGRWKPFTAGGNLLRPVETFYGRWKPSTAGGNLLRLVETFFSGETILRPGDSREDQRRDTLGHD